ncbi:type I glutamate--ammonia ligase [Myxococcota bacterium]|nr:type I glutamate--ammonia ligase [Myxococcota bacterium]MBU1382665.1 type I glutamate--ammonia ligase [Myxococcota bacterium]MBU1497243.1 type I glutamate--ammonia ligase [Myxococcota bacterium]
MFRNRLEAEQFAKKEHVKWIDIKFSDFEGNWRHVTVPSDDHAWNLFDKSGIGFDASSVKLQPLEKADMVLKPIWDTAFLDPFFPSKTLSFISEARDIVTDEPSPLDSRNKARLALELAKELGICDKAMFAPEYEFYVFKNISFIRREMGMGYTVTPLTDDENSNGLYIQPHHGYHALPPFDRHLEYRIRTAEILGELGIPIHYHHHEVGGSGQGEFEVSLTPIVKAGDHAMMVKYVSRQVAAQMGVSVTFMPKPINKHPGSGLHCHQNLWLNGKNVFYDKDGYCGLSKDAIHYIAGILDNGNALLAITNPSQNSYRRLVPGYEAPTKAFFSPGNRSAAIRIPTYANSPEEQRIEFRSPDATANPYLLLAGQLMAGIDGIVQKKDPTALGLGPVEENIFNWSEDRLKTLKSLPTSLDEALDALDANPDFLLRNDVFSKEFIEKWIKIKREEALIFRQVPHPFEIEMYYGV